MAKQSNSEHEAHPEGSDKTAIATDAKKDNLKNDRTADNTSVEKERAKAAEDFSVTSINVSEIQQANAALQNSGSAFVVYDSSTGETVARSKSKTQSNDAPVDMVIKEKSGSDTGAKSDIYDSGTIDTRAVLDQQMAFYKQALETVTDPEIRSQLKQQATMLDRANTNSKDIQNSPSQNSILDGGTDAAPHVVDKFSSKTTVSDGSPASKSAEQTNHLVNAKPIPDKYNRIVHLSTLSADYDFSYANKDFSNPMKDISKITITEKSGEPRIYEKKADGWYLVGSKEATFSSISFSNTTGELHFQFKNFSSREDYPDGRIEYSDHNSSFKRTPDGHGGYKEIHSGKRTDDNFTIAKTADGRFEIRDDQHKQPLKLLSDPKVVQAREALMDQARHRITNPEEFARFQTDMARFENREHDIEQRFELQLKQKYKQEGKSEEEIAKIAKSEAERLALAEVRDTYSHIADILKAGDKAGIPLDAAHRTMIAEQVLRNAASPTLIDQGNYGTCNVSVVEARSYTRHPADAAKLVADMVTEGKYSTKTSGKQIKINSEAYLNLDDSGSSIPPDGTRSLASQIFQVTAVNIHYAFDNTPIQRRYEQHLPDPKTGANGEELFYYEKNTGLKHNLLNKHDPGLYSTDQAQISMEITGDQPKEAYIRWDKEQFKTVSSIESEDGLKQTLQLAKDHGQMPVIIRVHTANEPLYTDSGAGTAGGSGGWHVITVTDYQAGPPSMVAVDNQWGSANDHKGKNKLTIDDLYFCMRAPDNDDQIKELESRRAHGNLAPRQEMDLDRHKHQKWNLLPDNYEQKMEQHLQDTHDLLQQKKISFDEYAGILKQFHTTLHDYPPEDRFKLLQFERDIGPIKSDEFVDTCVKTILQIHEEHKNVIGGNWNAIQQNQYSLALTRFNIFRSKLSPDLRDAIEKRVSNALK